MNIKRIGLIGGSGVVGGGTNSGSGGNKDNLWEITPMNTLEHTRYNAAVTISSAIVTSHIGKDNTDVIDISADDGIKIQRNYEQMLIIGTGVCIGTGSDKNKSVFIGSGVFIAPGFDSRNISGGGNGNSDNIWGLDNEYAFVDKNSFDIKLGTCVHIGSYSEVRIGKNTGIVVNSDSNYESIFIGTGVYIEPGFDSRNISGGSSGGDGLWKVEADLLTSRGSKRYVQLGTSVFIGTQGKVQIDGEREGIKVYNASGQSAIIIGTNVKIGSSKESVEIGENSIQIHDSFGDKSIFIGSQVHIGAGFDSRNYIDLDDNLRPERISKDSSLKDGGVLGVNIEPQSNGNIKIGNTLFMPATPSGDPMHYAYEAAGAEYNATNEDLIKDAPWKDYVDTEEEKKVVHKAGHWYINGLGDLTTQEVKVIYSESQFKSFPAERIFMNKQTRTLIDKSTAHPALSNRDYQYHTNKNIITVNFNYHNVDKLSRTFENCSKLKYITPPLNVKWVKSFDDTFNNCNSLISVHLYNVQYNISFASSSFISKSSVKYTIDNASPTSAITITLHADAYARLVNDSDIITALETKNAALQGTSGSISLVSA